MQADIEWSEPLRVVADQRLIGDVLALALTSRGVPACVERWQTQIGDAVAGSAGTAAPDRVPPVGALLSTVEDSLALSAALAFLRVSPVRWVAVTSGPADARWGALHAAGAWEVVDAAAGVDELVTAVQHTALGRPRPADALAERFSAWAAECPRAAEVLGGLTRLTLAERSLLGQLLHGHGDPAFRERLDSGTDPLGAVLAKLGVDEPLAAVAAVRDLDASSLFAGCPRGPR